MTTEQLSHKELEVILRIPVESRLYLERDEVGLRLRSQKALAALRLAIIFLRLVDSSVSSWLSFQHWHKNGAIPFG
jgi:hypothetical protein